MHLPYWWVKHSRLGEVNNLEYSIQMQRNRKKATDTFIGSISVLKSMFLYNNCSRRREILCQTKFFNDMPYQT